MTPLTARASFAQERLFFLNELDPGNPAYVVALALRLRGDLDVEALRRALTDLVARHDALRTGFEVTEGILHQHVRRGSGFAAVVRSGPCTDASLRELVTAEAHRPFALAEGEVVRATIVSGGPREHALVLLAHHVACDGWSVGILLSDLAARYNAHVAGRADPLPAGISYVDHSIAERTGWENTGADALAYWREQLDGVPRLSLPTDHPRPAVLSHRGGVLRRKVGTDLVDRLTGWARTTGASLFTVLVAAYANVLTRYARQDEVVIGVPVANRPDERAEAIVGCLVNMLPLRIDVAKAPTFPELVRQVRDTALAAFADEDVPFEEIVRSVATDRQLSHAPLVQTSCTLQNFPFALPALTGIDVDEVDVEIDAAKFDLGLTLDVSAAEPFLRLEYSTDLFGAESMAGLLDHVAALLGSVGSQEPSMVDSTEARLVVEEFNSGPRPPGLPGLLGRFEHHACRTPDAVAVRHGCSNDTSKPPNPSARSGQIVESRHPEPLRPARSLGQRRSDPQGDPRPGTLDDRTVPHRKALTRRRTEPAGHHVVIVAGRWHAPIGWSRVVRPAC
ncbi:MAG: condensation domain-containing protein, partial [Sciscionella sp.]